MVSLSLTKSDVVKRIQCNPSMWNGLLIGWLRQVSEHVHPSLTINDEALEFVESLVVQCLEILTLRSPQPKFPTLIEKWASRDAAKVVSDKSKKNNPLVLPTDKIHYLLQRGILQYKLDYHVALYITEIVEYVAADTLKLAGNYVKHKRGVGIGSEDLCAAICGDQVLMDLFGQRNDVNCAKLSNLCTDKIQRITTYEEVIRDLMHDQKKFVRDLNLILKVFKDKIYHIMPTSYVRDLDSIFDNIEAIFNVTRLLLDSIQCVLEIADDESATIGCCIKQLAEGATFDVFARYANDIVEKQNRYIFLSLINEPEVSIALQSADRGFKNAVKYYFVKLLQSPLWHCIHYFEYVKILHKLSPSQNDKDNLEQVEDILRPIQLQMISAAEKINLTDNVKEYGLKINSINRKLLAIDKLDELKKSINDWDIEDMEHYCTEFIKEGLLKVISSGGKYCSVNKVILFNDILILCKSDKRHSGPISSGFLSEFTKIFIGKMEIVDKEDTDEIKNYFEIIPRLQSPIILVANTFLEKANWMADLVMLNTNSMLDRMLNSILDNEYYKLPIILPSTDEYRFVEPDSDLNLIFEDEEEDDQKEQEEQEQEQEQEENNVAPIIKGATLLKLIERLTHHVHADPKFLNTFLTTYRSFCSPHDLLDLLIERYKIPEPNIDDTMDPLSLRSEKKRFKKLYLIPVKLWVLNVIIHWVDDHYYDYQQDQSLLYKLFTFLDSIDEKSMAKWTNSVIKILKRKTSNTQKEITFNFDSPPPPIEVHMDFSENDEFNILLVHPLEFARQLTLIESGFYRAIEPLELVGNVWPIEDKNIHLPNLSRLSQHTTNFIFWVEKCIVECENIDERVAVVSRFIEIMTALDELNNFNGVFSILSALTSVAIIRLRSTMAALNVRLEKALVNAQYLVSNDYEKYNDKLSSINPPCVPFIGIYLTIISQIGNSNSDSRIDRPDLIDFKKRRQVAEIIEKIQQYQNQPYCLNVEPKIMAFIENLNPFGDTSQTKILKYLFDQSVKIEPAKQKSVTKLLKCSRKWPNVNLKSPGIKPKTTNDSSTTPPVKSKLDKALKLLIPPLKKDSCTADTQTCELDKAAMQNTSDSL